MINVHILMTADNVSYLTEKGLKEVTKDCKKNSRCPYFVRANSCFILGWVAEKHPEIVKDKELTPDLSSQKNSRCYPYFINKQKKEVLKSEKIIST